MNEVTIPIDSIAESPKVSAVIMSVSEREGIPTGEAALLALRIFAEKARDSKINPQPEKAV